MRYLVILFFLFPVSACQPVVGPAGPISRIPDSFSVQQSDDLVQATDRWWEDFDVPQLNQLQHQLLSDNLSLRQAFYRLDQLAAQQRISEAELWPTLGLNASMRREQTAGISGESRASSGRVAVAAAYEIDLWQRLQHRATAADLRLQAGEDDIRTLMLSLSAQLTELYFAAIEQRAQLELVSNRLTHNQALVRIIEERYQAGLSAATELYQARQNLAQMEALLPQYQTVLMQAENAMAVLLGQAPGSIRVERRELPQITHVIDIGLPATLLQRRPDVSAALHQLAVADYELAAAVADRLPRLDLTANLGRSISYLSSGDVTGSVWSLALGLTQPLYDGGRLRAASDEREAIRNQRQVAAQLEILTAIEEVESALQAELYSAQRAASLEQQQQLNHNNLQLRRENYLRGLSDSLELLRSEMDHLEVRSQQLSNQRQWLNHRISLVRALGGDWMDAELRQQRHPPAKSQIRNFRATGNEPGWLVEVNGQSLTLVTDYGQHRQLFVTPRPQHDRTQGTTRYLISADKELLLREETCQDDMKGTSFPARAILTIDGSVFRGCADF